MAYDEKLVSRVRKLFSKRKGIAEKKMFGGLACMLHGKMCCGVLSGDLMVRVGPERYAAALARPYVRPMDFTGRPLRGFSFVSPAGYKTDTALRNCVQQAIDFATSIRVKKPRVHVRRSDS